MSDDRLPRVHGLGVTLLRSGQMEFRLSGMELRIDRGEAEDLLIAGLIQLGWASDHQAGLVVDGRSTMLEERRLLDEMERLRATGGHIIERVTRSALLGPWLTAEQMMRRHQQELRPAEPAPQAVLAEAAPDVSDLAGRLLFDDPVEQLQYEARHAYLLTVPPTQREGWPWPGFEVLPSFLADVERDAKTSRAQLLSALVDIVSGRGNEVLARHMRPFRKGGGDDGKPVIIRSGDGAVAWRANINRKTAAARRVMWWRRGDGGIELARLAAHDDLAMPER